MNLLPGWDERLQEVSERREPGERRLALPLCPDLFADASTLVDTADGADTEFRYDRPPVILGRGKEASDPRSICPLLLSLSLAEPARVPGQPDRLYSFVVDLHKAEVLDATARLLRLPLPFVGHFAQA